MAKRRRTILHSTTHVRFARSDGANLRLARNRLAEQAKNPPQVMVHDVLGRIAHGRCLGLECHRDARRAQQADVVVAISHGEDALRPDAEFVQQVP